MRAAGRRPHGHGACEVVDRAVVRVREIAQAGEAVCVLHVDVEHPDARLRPRGDADAVRRVVPGPPLLNLVAVGRGALRPLREDRRAGVGAQREDAPPEPRAGVRRRSRCRRCRLGECHSSHIKCPFIRRLTPLYALVLGFGRAGARHETTTR